VLPVVEISAKKLTRGWGNKVGRKNLWLNFGKILLKVAEKGPKNIFETSSLYDNTETLSVTKKNFYLILN
jgi:hypothetical protein